MSYVSRRLFCAPLLTSYLEVSPNEWKGEQSNDTTPPGGALLSHSGFSVSSRYIAFDGKLHLIKSPSPTKLSKGQSMPLIAGLAVFVDMVVETCPPFMSSVGSESEVILSAARGACI